MVSIIYNIALFLFALASLPNLLYQMAVHGKYKHSLSQRFGKDIPFVPEEQEVIWIHAVSVGETKAVAPLAKELKKRHPACCLIISNITETGHEEAIKTLPFADYFIYLPFDFPWVIEKALKRTHPNKLILCETDFWYNLLTQAKAGGAEISVVNGKISERSAKRFTTFSFFSHKLFDAVAHFCVQNAEFAERFKQIGIPAEKITVTGNLKFDYDFPPMSPEQKREWIKKLGITPATKVLTIASTHNPEEMELMSALKMVWEQFPDLKVLVAPRHPERFGDVAKQLEAEGLSYTLLSAVSTGPVKEKIVLVDAMGMLKYFFQLSDLAIVAGSYGSNVGGHNLLEPAGFGVPVLFGPNMHQQPELVNLILKYKAGMQVSLSQLPLAVTTLLSEPENAKQMGENGLRLLKENKGSVQKTLQAIDS